MDLNYFHTYVVDGVVFKVSGSPAFHDQLQADPARAAQFLTDNFGALEAQPVEAEGEVQDAKLWNHADILLLLEGYRERMSRFRDPKVKKIDLWKEIASVFHHSGIDHMTHDTLDRKFRNLKRTYTKVKQGKSSTGHNAVNWPYYDLMTEILTNDETVNIPEMVGTGVRSEGGAAGVSQALAPAVAACLAPEVVGGHGAGSESSNTPPARPSKWRRLHEYRSSYEDIEKSRVEALNRIADELRESNRIQAERNGLLRQLINRQNQS